MLHPYLMLVLFAFGAFGTVLFGVSLRCAAAPAKALAPSAPPVRAAVRPEAAADEAYGEPLKLAA